jgi:hypothetical protein
MRARHHPSYECQNCSLPRPADVRARAFVRGPLPPATVHPAVLPSCRGWPLWPLDCSAGLVQPIIACKTDGCNSSRPSWQRNRQSQRGRMDGWKMSRRVFIHQPCFPLDCRVAGGQDVLRSWSVRGMAASGDSPRELSLVPPVQAGGPLSYPGRGTITFPMEG